MKDEINTAPNYVLFSLSITTCLLGHVVFTIFNYEILMSPDIKYHTHHYQQLHISDHSTTQSPCLTHSLP
jgi:hypothetical protein